jgi:site-specific DNA recombinase
LARQIEGGRELATSRGWRIGWEFNDDDDGSALRGANRPDYEEVPRLARGGQVDDVARWQTSRLLRNQRERADAIELFGRRS